MAGWKISHQHCHEKLKHATYMVQKRLGEMRFVRTRERHRAKEEDLQPGIQTWSRQRAMTIERGNREGTCDVQRTETGNKNRVLE